MAESIKDVTQLIVWQKAHTLTLEIYKLTKTFPADERFGLISQMRRAAVSVPANIAEGFKRRGLKNKIQFYNIAQGSLEELRYYLVLSRDLQFLKDFKTPFGYSEDVARLLNRLIESIRNKCQE